MAENSGSKTVTIHTDGACDGNPGPGGWAAVLRFGESIREVTGGEPATTNNRMELQAAISGLKALKEPCEVTIFTDSEYLRRASRRGYNVGKPTIGALQTANRSKMTTCGDSLTKSPQSTALIGNGLRAIVEIRTTNAVINSQGWRYRKSADTIHLKDWPPCVKLSWPVEIRTELKAACSESSLCARTPGRLGVDG